MTTTTTYRIWDRQQGHYIGMVRRAYHRVIEWPSMSGALNAMWDTITAHPGRYEIRELETARRVVSVELADNRTSCGADAVRQPVLDTADEPGVL